MNRPTSVFFKLSNSQSFKLFKKIQTVLRVSLNLSRVVKSFFNLNFDGHDSPGYPTLAKVLNYPVIYHSRR